MAEEISEKKSTRVAVSKEELIEKIEGADNVLITVSQTPHLDQMAACLGLCELLQDLDKNAVVVHSSVVSKKLDFLKPDDVVRHDAESLRDLIISFAQSKVEKFRYSRENDQYNIMLTPNHRELIDEKDIKFSKGDFNIDLVLTVGVSKQSKLDGEVSKHDQLVDEIPLVNIVTSDKNVQKDVPTWSMDTASALTEMIFDLAKSMDCHISAQVANALLTGLIVETERFKNAKTRPEVMHIGGELITLGANPLMIVNSLEQTVDVVDIPEVEAKEMLEEALDGDASEYDMQKLAQKRRRAGGKSERLYMRYEDSDEEGLSFGEKAKGRKKAAKEHVLDQLSIDEEGNLKVVAEEAAAATAETQDVAEQPAGQTAAAELAPAAHASAMTPEAADSASASSGLASTAEGGIGMAQAPSPPPLEAATAAAASAPSIQPREISPAARDVGIQPASAAQGLVATPAAAVAPSIADMPAVAAAASDAAAPQAAPSISDIVNRSAPPIAPGPGGQVAAPAPDATTSATDYVNNLAGADEAPPSVSGANTAGQALSVDNYMASQSPPGAAPGQSYAPPSAPPLPSMS